MGQRPGAAKGGHPLCSEQHPACSSSEWTNGLDRGSSTYPEGGGERGRGKGDNYSQVFSLSCLM